MPKDLGQAYMWFDLAAARLDDWFAEFSGEAVMFDAFIRIVSAASTGESAAASRERVAAEMTPGQIAEAQALATNWKPKHE